MTEFVSSTFRPMLITIIVWTLTICVLGVGIRLVSKIMKILSERFGFKW